MGCGRIHRLLAGAQVLLLAAVVFFSGAASAHAFFGGLKKWIKNEVVPTLQGKRPLKIDPNRVTVTHEGKKILEVAGNTAQINIGSVSVKTNDLRKTLAQIGAVYAGNTAVLAAMAEDEAKRHLKKMLDGNVIKRTGPNTYEAVQREEAAPRGSEPVRTVTLYNLTGATLAYAMNDQLFSFEDDSGNQHSATEHYLQIDTDAGEGIALGHWSLESADQYILTLASDKRSILLCRLAPGASQLACFDRKGPVPVPAVHAAVAAEPQ